MLLPVDPQRRIYVGQNCKSMSDKSLFSFFSVRRQLSDLSDEAMEMALKKFKSVKNNEWNGMERNRPKIEDKEEKEWREEMRMEEQRKIKISDKLAEMFSQ